MIEEKAYILIWSVVARPALVETESWENGMIGGWLEFILKVAVFKLVGYL